MLWHSRVQWTRPSRNLNALAPLTAMTAMTVNAVAARTHSVNAIFLTANWDGLWSVAGFAAALCCRAIVV